MTYCLGIKLDEGLVFCSDSRTNAGADRVSVYSKLHRFSVDKDRQLVLLSAGNLATSQAVKSRLSRDILEDADVSITKSHYLSDIADYIGQVSLGIQRKYAPPGGPDAGFNPEASFIFGGQLKGGVPELYHIYPEGNHIVASEQHPFFQIGETKYGKPILDRIIEAQTPHEIAMRCALVSMDSTIRSSATVGPPIELLFIERDNFSGPNKYYSFDRYDEYLVKMRRAWNEEVVQAFNDLPSLNEVFGSD